jgi:hypothetical protein
VYLPVGGNDSVMNLKSLRGRRGPVEVDSRRGELIFRVESVGPIFIAAPFAVILGWLLWTVIERGAGESPWRYVSVAAAVVNYVSARRPRAITLRVSTREFLSTGYIGGERDMESRIRRVSHAEICAVEFVDDGLYAILRRQRVCLLPDIYEAEAANVLETIKAKFPNIDSFHLSDCNESEGWVEAFLSRRNSITRLGLDAAPPIESAESPTREHR